MTSEEKRERTEEGKLAEKEVGEGAADVCADIHDPVRRGLCKICNMPVVGEAPFCKDHEPPVP
ncbi:MAG: hypothetical protein HY914_10695 [Desulfomonile tiedjei]|nr:hypothetical protein [Desulfomonile tiedjei]